MGSAVVSAEASVIDHKALWRANLYISEQSTDENPVVDWNNENRWDAPPDEAMATAWQAAGRLPWWWHEDYGYNEWNRVHDGETIFTNIEDLAVGDGGQTVEIASFTPVRSLNDDGEVTVQQVLNTVAYDYPVNASRAFIASLSNDSVFDYNRKLLLQRQAIRDGGEVDGRWPPEGFTLATLSNWQATTAPGNWWGRYRVDPLPTTSQGEGRLPGLGLYFYDRQSTYIANRPTLNGYGEAIWAALLAAGVDCIGFAQRVFDYPMDPYKWISLGGGGGRIYPMMATDAVDRGQATYSELIVGQDIGGLPADESLYRYIKPGDILYTRFGANEPADIRYHGRHIAIVQSVERDENGAVQATGIKLIESRFAGNVDFVTVNNTEGQTLNEYLGDNWRIVRLQAVGD